MPAYPKAAPSSRVVRGEELQDLFRAVKGAFHNLVSSSCTSGKNGTRGGRWEPARPPPRNHSSSLKGSGRGGHFILFFSHEPDILGGPGKHSRHLWVWLGQCYHTRRGQRSRVVIPGERAPSDAAIDIWSSGEAPKETGGVPRSAEVPARSNGNPTGCGALEGWGTPLGKPSPWPSITSDSTGCSATLGARTNAESRQRQRDSAMFDSGVYTQLRDGHVPLSFFFSFEEEHEPSTKASSACWMPRHVRQRSWPSWAPGNDHTQKRTGD